MSTTTDPALAAPARSNSSTPSGSARDAQATASGKTTRNPDSPRRPRPLSALTGISGTRAGGLVISLILPAAILLAWQIGATSGLVSVAQLPSPEMVFVSGIDLIERGLLGPFIGISLQRVLVGFTIGAALGLLFGAIVGLSKIWEQFFGSTFGAIRAVPSLAWVPLLLLWLKIGEESKLTLIAIGAFFPVYTTVAAALRHVDRQLVEAGRAFGLAGVALFRTIQLPAVLPAVISGLRLALAQAWLFLVAAELLASSQGLGFLLLDSQNNGRTDRVILAIILLAIFGKTTDALLSLFEKWAVRRWA